MKSNLFKLRSRISSGSSEKFQYELDKSKSNKTVLKIDDKQTVTYVPSTSHNNGNQAGISLIHKHLKYPITHLHYIILSFDYNHHYLSISFV